MGAYYSYENFLKSEAAGNGVGDEFFMLFFRQIRADGVSHAVGIRVSQRDAQIRGQKMRGFQGQLAVVGC